MKLLPLGVFAATILFAIALVESCMLAANAQGIQYSGITNALVSPNSSQLFFQRGRDLFDIEIQRLQNPSRTSLPVLHINPDILQQQKAWQEQQERLLEQMIQESNEQSLP